MAVKRATCMLAGALLAAGGLMFLAPGRAHAADLDVLRGSFSNPFVTSSYRRWDGVNLGVQFGITNMSTDFGSSTSSEVAFILRNSTLESEAAPSNWTTLPNDETNGRNYGLFLGYSVQWDQLVVGFDAAYNRASSVDGSASDSINRSVTTSDGVNHNVTITAKSSMNLIDYATLRARAGYAIGQFLPYAFAGGAVGRFNYANTATVTSIETPPAPAAPFTYGPITQSDSKDNAILGGFTAGLGLDVALLPNVFLRGEWEFVGFAQVDGIRSTINSGRIGLGMRF
ncbi:MAG TPA: outer membrane beta-barrel protein [Pseudolabrys sp.]|nr:outer membrane beta-barrel protein [Pseudolabrys sp.]